MTKTPLNKMLGKSSLMVFKEDAFWPISDQFIGIEIELEGQSKAQLQNHINGGNQFWVTHQDNSLRNGIELVLAQPMMGQTLRDAISYFFRTFTKYTATPRTSIHVHINMLQPNETIEALQNMVVLYYMFEEAFFAIADENRKWNGYCNAFEDTPPAVLEAVMQYADDEKMLGLKLQQSAQHNNNRYYALNLNALTRFGTLEFRHLPLFHEEQRLVDWIKLIMELKAAALRMSNEGCTPADIFKNPDDVVKLENYMPQFGRALLAHVDAHKAFIRMVNVHGLKLALAPYHKTVEGNKAWARFLKAQEPAVVKDKPKPSSRKAAMREMAAEAPAPRLDDLGDPFRELNPPPRPQRAAATAAWPAAQPPRPMGNDAVANNALGTWREIMNNQIELIERGGVPQRQTLEELERQQREAMERMRAQRLERMAQLDAAAARRRRVVGGL